MRLIDADKAISDYAHDGISHPYDAYDLEDILNECPIIEAIPKADYEARLKADMVAMLTEIQLEIEEQYSKCDLCEYIIDYDYDENDISEYRSVGDIKDITNIIQQKINDLKGDKEYCKHRLHRGCA